MFFLACKAGTDCSACVRLPGFRLSRCGCLLSIRVRMKRYDRPFVHRHEGAPGKPSVIVRQFIGEWVALSAFVASAPLAGAAIGISGQGVAVARSLWSHSAIATSLINQHRWFSRFCGAPGRTLKASPSSLPLAVATQRGLPKPPHPQYQLPLSVLPTRSRPASLSVSIDPRVTSPVLV
jgi:hypothetical protein